MTCSVCVSESLATTVPMPLCRAHAIEYYSGLLRVAVYEAQAARIAAMNPDLHQGRGPHTQQAEPWTIHQEVARVQAFIEARSTPRRAPTKPYEAAYIPVKDRPLRTCACLQCGGPYETRGTAVRCPGCQAAYWRATGRLGGQTKAANRGAQLAVAV